MGRKTHKKQNKPDSESQEEEEQHSEVEEVDQDEELHAEDHQQEEQLDRQDQQVLQIIEAHCKEVDDDGERLTWMAIYSLKKQEIELTQKMNEEINQLKDKYDLLKQPIYAEMASAAVGKKVEPELYKPSCVDLPANFDKIVPSALPNYWQAVFLNSGLIEEQQDIETFEKLQSLQCELIEPLKNHLKMTFTFKEQPSIFSNKVLSIESLDNIEDETFKHVVKVQDPINWKGKKNQKSVFFILFDPKSNPSQISQLMGEFYRDFSNSIYFYMRKGDLEEIEGLEDEDQDEDEEIQKEAKPSKKQKKQLEKPECKQQ